MNLSHELLDEYNREKIKARERLELVFLEFGPLQYWEELHYLQGQILNKYNIRGTQYG